MGAIDIILICVIGGGAIVVMMMWVSRLSLYDLFPFLVRKAGKSEDEKWVDFIIEAGSVDWKLGNVPWQTEKGFVCQDFPFMVTFDHAYKDYYKAQLLINDVRITLSEEKQIGRLRRHINDILRSNIKSDMYMEENLASFDKELNGECLALDQKYMTR